MPLVISMPTYSATMETGKLIKWLVEEGAQISTGQVIAEIETDKAVGEIEAPSSGQLTRILVEAGDDDIPVNTPLAEIAIPNEPASTEAVPQSRVQEESKAISSEPTTRTADDSHDHPQRSPASPAARSLARQAGIDIGIVAGSGPRGRITRNDVQQFLDQNLNSDTSHPAGATEIQPSTLRRSIAKAMVHAKQTVPHFYLETDLIIDELLSLKREMESSAGSVTVTITAFLVRATALALKEIPAANRYWKDDTIVTKDSCDIGIAVSIPDGIVVPVIRSSENLSLQDIAAEIHRLTSGAREGSLQQTDLGDASLTISNLGMFGVDRFYPIINPPEPMILGIGRGRVSPWIIDDQIEIRNIMCCTVSADHRIMDGVSCARFLGIFADQIQAPARLIST